jgi:uracil-DNA glycosylase
VERDNCFSYLERELAYLSSVKAVLALGAFAYGVSCRLLGVRPCPRFGHGAEVRAEDGRSIVCSYHPSQQNTFTGRLTAEMLSSVVERAWQLAS